MVVKIFSWMKEKMGKNHTSSLFPLPSSLKIRRHNTSSLFPLPSSLKSGFTVLELLVASLLLSMLVTILTMIFNQSSIAWTTGVASMSEQSGVRVKLSAFHDVEDDILPGLGQDGISSGGSTDNREITYRTVSIFKGWDGAAGSFASLRSSAPREDNNMRGRAYDKFDDGQLGGLLTPQTQIGGLSSFLNFRTVNTGTGGAAGANKGALGGGGMATYIVGVRSWGPDGRPDSPDDITSYPEGAN